MPKSQLMLLTKKKDMDTLTQARNNYGLPKFGLHSEEQKKVD